MSPVTCAPGSWPGLAVCPCPVTHSYHSRKGYTLCRGQGCFFPCFHLHCILSSWLKRHHSVCSPICLRMTGWILGETGEQTPGRTCRAVRTVAHVAWGGALSFSSHSSQHRGRARCPQAPHTAHFLEPRQPQCSLPVTPCAPGCDGPGSNVSPRPHSARPGP